MLQMLSVLNDWVSVKCQKDAYIFRTASDVKGFLTFCPLEVAVVKTTHGGMKQQEHSLHLSLHSFLDVLCSHNTNLTL